MQFNLQDVWYLAISNADEELSIPEVALVAAKIKKMGVAQVSIGGEPFARDDLEALVDCF